MLDQSPAAQSAASGTERDVSSTAERRQLTVMFCDLVGSTPLSERLDPEDFRDLLLAYRNVCASAIDRYGGRVARYIGDGLLVYFGYPAAHEDDPGRAARAGLEIVADMRELNERLAAEHRPSLDVRIGIHTGLVVAGDIGSGARREEMAIVGDTPNVAARLQQLARPNAVTVSDVTRRLIGGFFICRDRGIHRLKGISSPLQLYEVLDESGAKDRLNAAGMKITRLFGREPEISLLLDRWEQVQAGTGQSVLLVGEAGIGKSRIVRELRRRLQRRGIVHMTCHCSAYHSASAFFPLIELLNRLLELDPDDTPASRRERLEAGLMRLGLEQPGAVPLLAALLDLSDPKNVELAGLSPQRQKEKTVEALVEWLIISSDRRAVLFVIEDVHWADDSTLGFIGALLGRLAAARVLFLLTSRPGLSASWMQGGRMSQVVLGRLSVDQRRAMVRQLTGRRPLPAVVVEEIVVKTDGVPLFVEELTKTVVGASFLRELPDRYELAGPLPQLSIPTTLRDSLMARLDRLTDAKSLAQLGAAFGRSFSHELLRAVARLSDDVLERRLQRLVDEEFLLQRGTPPKATYIFRHVLIQEAAYDSLLIGMRSKVHRQIAEVLEDRFPETVESQPEILARHHEMAGATAAAIRGYEFAGRRADERSANVEAAAHFGHALELLSTLPETKETAQKELSLQIALGAQFVAIKGYAAPEVEAAFGRARSLCERVGESLTQFRALRGLESFYMVRGRIAEAHKMGRRLLALAQRAGDPDLLLQANRSQGLCLLYMGKFTRSHTHLVRALSMYNEQRHSGQRFEYGGDPAVLGRSNLAWTEWFLGYPDRALESSRAALQLASKLSHSHSVVYAIGIAALLHQLRRETREVLSRAREAVDIADEHRFPYWSAWGTALLGWAVAEEGDAPTGIRLLEQGLSAYRETGAEVMRPYFLALMAEAKLKIGRADEAIATVEEGLALAQVSGTRFCEAELHRLKGSFLLGEGRGDTAVACLKRATAVARRQGAKSAELRALISLVRMRRHGREQENALAALGRAYGAFTEGLDGMELREAKGILAEGSARPETH